ncbi:tryptophan synthase subunit alpha [Curtobacterium sp. MCJR17_055]|uniref:tryptophan synthase subunit alpha n=1 Tax=unclassified Curtobacterium TaxID=257496 RepID=UPI000D97E9FB|nr:MULTISPECIES: tryptophan synthase subunit alpha [unclassified Curtobacterium]PYY35147.1 tryptophan synthase subunit alpha [Curtobacterium sp. MCBD17_029]PYY55572.1 tryptophan synthase subunit alpha [Curtobacterium sp. MCJR17_055]PYY60318.1 tryptophan synthase subunit alpha [Curtobacterium sp. MCPF17_015]WIB35075.1 tryptophan synthase subunit alpha [Curtobacterium sp. MCJR17_043]
MSTNKTVAATIDRANDERAGAVVGYLPAGYPDLQTSIDAAVALAENGVDVIELGLPYSDPVMDGPVIQRAAEESLANGFKVAQVFDAVHAITEGVDTPVLVMTYWNPVLRYGVDRFADDLVAAGAAGLITPDLIPDEGRQWIDASERTGLDRVFLAAPSSTDARMKQAVDRSRGFVYAVSTMGVTGARSGVDSAARTVVSRLRDAGVERTCVGLGISTADQVAEVLEYADGAIIGSAFVRALADLGVTGVAERAADLSSGSARR